MISGLRLTPSCNREPLRIAVAQQHPGLGCFNVHGLA